MYNYIYVTCGYVSYRPSTNSIIKSGMSYVVQFNLVRSCPESQVRFLMDRFHEKGCLRQRFSAPNYIPFYVVTYSRTACSLKFEFGLRLTIGKLGDGVVHFIISKLITGLSSSTHKNGLRIVTYIGEVLTLCACMYAC